MPGASDSISARGETTAWLVLIAISGCHLITDVMQFMLQAIYPLLQEEFQLSYGQIGMISLGSYLTASIFQPVIGGWIDRHPMPRSLSWGMVMTMLGVVLIALATNFTMLLLASILIGLGSAVFHPESSRVARVASGGRFGAAQSLFQLGGNFGQALGPLLAAIIIVPLGRPSTMLFAIGTMIGVPILWRIGTWTEGRRLATAASSRARAVMQPVLGHRRVMFAIGILTLLTFSKNIYTFALTSYYTFFLIDRFGMTAQQSQMMLFLFLGSQAVGVMMGGLVGDRVGPRMVIWFSILGALPFTLALPHVGLHATIVLTAMIGLVIASAFPAIIVFAQELMPGRTGLVAGLFFGLAFGVGGVAAALLGQVADAHGIRFVFLLCSFLPMIGLLTVFLPRQREMVQVF